MKKRSHIGFGIVLSLLVVYSSCKKEDDTPAQAAPLVSLKTSATLGNYLVDKDGRTLYYFSNDADGQSSCTGGCEAVWPVFDAGTISADKLGTGLDMADFSSVTTQSGKKQTTYKGWPLYYYAPPSNGTNVPEAAGQTSGEGVGGVWFVAKPDYTIMLVNAQLKGHDGKNYTSDYKEGNGKTLYFTDGNGITLYAFSFDKANTNNFTKPDFSNNDIWPIYETDKVVVPSTLEKSLFGSIDVFGKKQLTYKGWPLYYFGQDAKQRGNNKGISFPKPGIWPVVMKDTPAAP